MGGVPDVVLNKPIEARHLGDDSVTSAKIATDAVGASEIAANAVGTSEIATDGVGAAEIAAGAVGTSEIADGTVALDDLVSTVRPIQHTVVAGLFTTLGGDATEVISNVVINAGDTALVLVQKAGGTPRTVDSVVVTDDTLTITMSGDPSTDHKLAYFVFRAAA